MFTCQPIEDADGSVDTLLAVAIDVTEPVRLRRELENLALRERVARGYSVSVTKRALSEVRGPLTLTPMDQGPSEGDRKMTQQIRQAVVKDGSLSFTAKNVKIITINGKVTLRGPVKTDAEKSAIEAEATKVAGAGQVDNLLEVKN